MAVTRRLGDVIDEYLDLRERHKKAATHRADRGYLLRMLAHIGNIQIRHLESRHIQAFMAEPTPRGIAGLSPDTYNQALCRIRSFDRYCRELGYVHRALVPGTVTSMKVPVKRRARYTAVQLLEIIDAADHPRDRFLLALLCNTALRGGEALPLRWRDVHEDEQVLDVTVFKSDRIDRRPITEDLATELRRWRAYVTAEVGFPQPDWYLACKKNSFRFADDGNGLTFYDPSRARIVPAEPMHNPERIVQRSLAKLGHPTLQEGGHTIRRSVALIYFEQLVAQGFDDALLTVSALLNHKDVTVTQRYLGLDRHVEKRDLSLKGEPFLTRGVTEGTVTLLHETANPL